MFDAQLCVVVNIYIMEILNLQPERNGGSFLLNMNNGDRTRGTASPSISATPRTGLPNNYTAVLFRLLCTT